MSAAGVALQPDCPRALIDLSYVSDCLIPAGERAPGLAALVSHAGAANRARGVTGALMLAGNHFVQTLEGERAEVDRLMQRILHDPRHAVLRIVDHGEFPARNFPSWMAVYSGSSVYLCRQVSRALANHGLPGEGERLLRLMRDFSAPLPRRRR